MFAALACAQDAPVAPAKPIPAVSLAPWALHAKLVDGAPPEYPASARENKVEGDAFVDVVVDENGKVETASWVDYLNCSSIIGEAAAAAVKRWQYQPTILDGKPVRVRSWIAFRFRLEGEPSVDVLTRSEASTPAAEPARINGPQRLRISSGVAEGNLILKVDPEYPMEAKIAHVQGDVVMSCLIDRQGDVLELKVLSGHPLLAKAALDAVKQWKYKPYLLNGNPVMVQTTVTLRFHL